MLDDYLARCAVLGAGGKMGSGIALLILREMARSEAERSGKIAGEGRLILIDKNEQALTALRTYLKDQLTRYAEKNIISLRSYFREREELIENREMIEEFTGGALSLIRLDTEIEKSAGARLIFEAILENVDLKAGVYSGLKDLCGPDTYFLTNTSSIPIAVLNDRAGLGGRIIGFHFYNPPAVQKLVEVIASPATDQKLVELAGELGKRLQKTLIPSNDVAGFIGNGHFMRDILFGIGLVSKLEEEAGSYQAVYLVNKICQDFMVRPMGIFQLTDYVGLDICRMIMKIMSTYIEGETLHSDLIDSMLEAGAAGGRYPDGSQKDGFFKYIKGRPGGVYSLKKTRYIMMEEGDWVKESEARLGDLPQGHFPWKALMKDPLKDEKLKAYFSNLFAAGTPGAGTPESGTLGAGLARRYLLESRRIAEKLVRDRIANKIEDVNAVLKNGFYHLYGPKNDLF